MIKKLILSSLFLFSFSAYSLHDVDKPLLAKICHELSQIIELLSRDQTEPCTAAIKEAAVKVESGGQYILREYWYSARTDLHRSYRLLTSTNPMKCKAATEIALAQKGIDGVLNQIYGLE